MMQYEDSPSSPSSSSTPSPSGVPFSPHEDHEKRGKLVGVVSRSDVIQLLMFVEFLWWQPHYLFNLSCRKDPSRFPLSTQQTAKNLKSNLKQSLPKDIYKLLQIAGELGVTLSLSLCPFSLLLILFPPADGLDVSVYVVGGFVRDLLLHLPNDDVDFVVEVRRGTFLFLGS